MKPQAVLFDFDGTLADTMQDNFLAWKKAFNSYGIFIKKEDYFPLEGMKLKEIAKEISKKYGLNTENYDNIVESKNRFYLQNHSFKLYPFADEIINLLKNTKLKLAVVSASPREKLEKTAPISFFKNFDIVISGDDVDKGKPHPESYLKAAEKLSVFPEDCIVVENAPLGIRSAKAAGIFCIAISSTLNEKYLSEADIVVHNLKEIIPYIVK